MRIAFALLTLMALASCGADGSPQEPEITISGEAKIGVKGTF